MNILVWICLGWAAAIASLAIVAGLAIVYHDIVCPILDRRRTRIASPDHVTFVEDPFVSRRYGDPLRVIGGSGAGSSTADLPEEGR